MRWIEDAVAGGVRQRRFDITGDGRTVPGSVWTPADGLGPRPLVAIGHGAGGSKSQGYVVALARRLVGTGASPWRPSTGPVHGDRRADHGSVPGLAFFEFSQMWAGDPA